MRTTLKALVVPAAGLLIGGTVIAGAQMAAASGGPGPGPGVTVGDQMRDRVRDVTCDPALAGDQARDRLMERTCDATCDGDQTRQQLRDGTGDGPVRDRIHVDSTAG